MEASMTFSVNTRKVDDVVILDMSGRLTTGEPVLLLRNTVRRFVDDGNVKFVLSLAGVSYIDSVGLGELVACYTTIRNRKGNVKLLKISAVARQLLQMTKLLTVFETYEDEQTAVSSLRSAAAHG
jgi:anti-sigma B factor antagonist